MKAVQSERMNTSVIVLPVMSVGVVLTVEDGLVTSLTKLNTAEKRARAILLFSFAGKGKK